MDKMRKKKYKAKEMPSSKGAGEALAVAAAVWCCFVTGKTKKKKRKKSLLPQKKLKKVL